MRIAHVACMLGLFAPQSQQLSQMRTASKLGIERLYHETFRLEKDVQVPAGSDSKSFQRIEPNPIDP